MVFPCISSNKQRMEEKNEEDLVYRVHTTHAKMTAMAKSDPPVPCCKAIAAARAVTVAECEEGIPPELNILLESHLFSLYLHI